MLLTPPELIKVIRSNRTHWSLKCILLAQYVKEHKHENLSLSKIAHDLYLNEDFLFDSLRLAHAINRSNNFRKIPTRSEALWLLNKYQNDLFEFRKQLQIRLTEYKIKENENDTNRDENRESDLSVKNTSNL